MNRIKWAAAAAVGMVTIGATSAWAWTVIEAGGEGTGAPIRNVTNVRQLYHQWTAPEDPKMRSDCFIGVSPLETRLTDGWNTTTWNSSKATVESEAYISCQDEPDLAFTRIKYTFGLGSNAYSDSLGEDRTFDAPKTYGVAGSKLAEFVVPCRTLAPGKAGTPATVSSTLNLRLWDTEGRKWEAFVFDQDTIICPRKP